MEDVDEFNSKTQTLKIKYNKVSEDYYFSILPTATQYARNSFFAGLMPSEKEKRFTDKWFNDN